MNGSFKDVLISVQAIAIDNGEGTDIKQYPFPSLNTQTCTLQTCKYVINIEDPVTKKHEQSLLTALKSNETGDVILPFYGLIYSVTDVEYGVGKKDWIQICFSSCAIH